jgi:beta-N-acetylhexosaminidase
MSDGATIDKKIGEMLLVGFRGLKLDDDHFIVRSIRDYSLGSTILFDYDVLSQTHLRNIKSPLQVKKLVESLQKLSQNPLIISIDHEGGKVIRLKEDYGFPATVSFQYLGTLDDLSLTNKYAAEVAQTLYNLGINLNLAPVVDLNVNPQNPVIGELERSFSFDPEIVTGHALEFIRAHHEQGVLCTLKHFPGHGSSAEDSHLGFVDITDSWKEQELQPYKNLIQEGEVDAIMTGHVFHLELDPQFPATLSKSIITGLLREKFDYDGVIISDDLQMGAITKNYGFDYAVEKAINAGIDILAMGNNLLYDDSIVSHTVKLIFRLLNEGVISEERIDESYRRIQKLKKII